MHLIDDNRSWCQSSTQIGPARCRNTPKTTDQRQHRIIFQTDAGGAVATVISAIPSSGGVRRSIAELSGKMIDIISGTRRHFTWGISFTRAGRLIKTRAVEHL